jgi:hypothetical protein
MKGAHVKIICPTCQYHGDAVEIPKGTKKTEILLWCCLLLPGLLYTLWRQSRDGRYLGCPQCREGNVRPVKRKEWKTLEKTGRLPA